MKKTLHELPITELPRERMLKFGGRALSDTELLALLLRSGGPNLNALQLAQYLLSEFGNLRQLLAADVEQLKKVKYLGEAKVCSLKAVKELAKRCIAIGEIRKPHVETPEEVYDLLLPLTLGEEKEHLYLLSLDLNGNLIKLSLISMGSLTQTLADTREILRTALLKGAVSVILAHNHPNNNPKPSDPDKQLTKEIALACPKVGLNFLDHIIVTNSGYFSFKLAGLLNYKSERR
ncbi:DNA repair protein RadC [candidate division WWE3 bacterium]|nr:DNA repair protein RadC [candidate division WWE3 bacterium]